MVDRLLVDPEHDWAVGEQLLLGSSLLLAQLGVGSGVLTHQSQPHPRNFLWGLEAVSARQWPQSSQRCAIWAAC